MCKRTYKMWEEVWPFKTSFQPWHYHLRVTHLLFGMFWSFTTVAYAQNKLFVESCIVVGWNVTLQKIWWSPVPSTCEWILFRKKVFTNVIKLRCPPIWIGQVLIQSQWCCHKKRKMSCEGRDTWGDIQEECPRITEAEMEMLQLQVREHQRWPAISRN